MVSSVKVIYISSQFIVGWTPVAVVSHFLTSILAKILMLMQMPTCIYFPNVHVGRSLSEQAWST